MKDDNRRIHIEGSEGIIAGSTVDAGGDVIVNGQKVTNITLNTTYQNLVKRKEELEVLIKNLPPENQMRSHSIAELEELLKTEEQYKRDIIQLAEKFSRLTIDSESLMQARTLFLQGFYEEADKLLDKGDLKKDKEAVLLEEQKLETALEQIKKKKEQVANGY